MSRAKLIRRLNGYWRMELGNAALVPGAAFILVSHFNDTVTWPTALAGLANVVLLLIGAQAWRMELAGLQGKPQIAAY